MDVIVVLPVYNEETALRLLLPRFVALDSVRPLKVVAVDDGSTDASVAELQRFADRLSIEILHNGRNRGLGETIQRGLISAADKAGPADVVVTLDADNTHPPELILEMLAALEAGHDLVIASRYRPSARVVGLSRFRLAMSEGARVVFQLLTPIPGVRDYTCGFRAYRAELLQRVIHRFSGRLATESGFACMAEILLRCAAAGARIGEVPLELRYDLKGGASKMKVSATVLRILRLAWKNRALARGAPQQERP